MIYYDGEVINMAQATLTARLDPMDKQKFETFCNSVGLTVSGAINLYVKAVLKKLLRYFNVVLIMVTNRNSLITKKIKNVLTGGTISRII